MGLLARAAGRPECSSGGLPAGGCQHSKHRRLLLPSMSPEAPQPASMGVQGPSWGSRTQPALPNRELLNLAQLDFRACSSPLSMLLPPHTMTTTEAGEGHRWLPSLSFPRRPGAEEGQGCPAGRLAASVRSLSAQRGGWGWREEKEASQVASALSRLLGNAVP